MKKNTIILSFIFSWSILFASDAPFDEVFGTSKDSVRSVYDGIYQEYKNLTPLEKEKKSKQTLKDFKGDNALSTLPRVLTPNEFDILEKGVKQRGSAIREFLKDHYSNRRYLQDGVIPKQVIDRVLMRAKEEDWDKFIKPKHISFWYAPDIIRGPPEEGHPEGRFYVVEDNPNFVGGMGDLIQARESLEKIMPKYISQTSSPHPKKFYDEISKEYKKMAKEKKGIALMVRYPKSMSADNEDLRVQKIFKERGIESYFLDPDATFYRRDVDGKRLIVDESGTWLEYQDGKKLRVGHVIVNMDPSETAIGHSANEKFQIIMEAELELEQSDLPKKYRKKLEHLMNSNETRSGPDYESIKKYLEQDSPYQNSFDRKRLKKGLIDSLIDGKITMTNVPGTEFIGDKELYIYVEDLIRYYLKEEPILRNMHTGSFSSFTKSKKEILNSKAMKEVFLKLENYVIKGVDGRGGDAVWVGPKITKEMIPALKEMIKKNPGRYIFQKYTALSTIDGNIGDLRLLSNVSQTGVRVANVPWARLVSKDGNGKVNISDNGFEATVLINTKLKCLKSIAKKLEIGN